MARWLDEAAEGLPPAPRRLEATGSLLIVALLSGCPKTTDGPPKHYEDPKAMIQVFENTERDGWQMPDRVIKSLPVSDKHAVVADIGAGSGYFTRRLAREVPEGRVYAVDVDNEFEEYLLANRESWGTPNIEPHLAHYDDPMLPVDSLDLVFTANTYAYIRNRVSYFSRVRETLKPGGHLGVIEFRPGADAPGDIAPEERYRVSVDTAKQELGEAGFTVVSEETFLPHQWFLVLKAND
jgi:predicted methyltransferase